MIVSRDFPTAVPRSPVRVDQGLRIDFEVGFRSRMNIGGGQDSGNSIAGPKQDAATLAWACLLCLGEERFDEFRRDLKHSTSQSVRPELVEGPSCNLPSFPRRRESSNYWVEFSTLDSRLRGDDVPSLSLMPKPNTLSGTLGSATRLDKALAEASGLSRERVKALMAQEAVLVGKTVATNPSAKMQPGAKFEITVPPTTQPDAQPQDIPLDIVFEDEHLLVVNKPAGMVVHPAAGNQDGTLVNALLHHCRGQLSGINGVARPGIVHRIDKDTSGLLVVAKTDAAHEGLALQFADHSIDRRYLAICAGHPRPQEGTVEARLGRSDRDRKKMAVLPKDSSRGKHAVTHYKTLQTFCDCALIECRLETGRTHQVRVHCQSIGHPLLGDPTYGSDPKGLRPLLKHIGFARQALHAADLGFIHSATGQGVAFTADLPADMQELIDETERFNR